MLKSWCLNCTENVPVKDAQSQQPCPRCGANQYFILNTIFKTNRSTKPGDVQRYCEEQANELMRLGQWELAVEMYRKKDVFSLEEAKEKIAYVMWIKLRVDYLYYELDRHPDGILYDDLRQKLLVGSDEKCADWLLNEYRKVKVINDGKTCMVYRK